jgi:branched-chain amino acid transport system permease protein
MYKTLGFAISAMLMGFMGACFTTRFAYVNTDTAFDPLYSFLPPVMTLLGGVGAVYGPIIGSITLSLLRDILSVALTYYFLIILGLILITIVMLMPDGIMGILGRIELKKPSGSKKGTKKG